MVTQTDFDIVVVSPGPFGGWDWHCRLCDWGQVGLLDREHALEGALQHTAEHLEGLSRCLCGHEITRLVDGWTHAAGGLWDHVPHLAGWQS